MLAQLNFVLTKKCMYFTKCYREEREMSRFNLHVSRK